MEHDGYGCKYSMDDNEQACSSLQHEEGDGWQVEGMDVGGEEGTSVGPLLD